MKNKRRVLSQAVVNTLIRSGRIVSFEDTVLESVVFPSPSSWDHLNFRNAILKNVDFSDKDLGSCDFTGASIYYCNFTRAFLPYSNFYSSKIDDSDFSEANLRGSIFCNSRIWNCKFIKSDLHNTDIGSGVTSPKRLLDADNDFTDALYFQKVPTEGSFIGWKEAIIWSTIAGEPISRYFLVKLLIPEDAKRSSAFGIKCRCNKAVVLDIFNLDGSLTEYKLPVHSIRDYAFVYEKGKTVEVPDFDDCWWHECSAGIHFFLDKKAAMLYTEKRL